MPFIQESVGALDLPIGRTLVTPGPLVNQTPTQNATPPPFWQEIVGKEKVE